MKIQILFFSILIVFFALSIILNYLFYKKAFIPLQALRLDPLGLNYYSSLPRNEKKKIMMYYGDSRALSWPFIKNNKFSFINRAIGNQTSIQIVARFENHVVPYKPEIILIQMCINDLKMFSLFPDKKNQILKGCKENIKHIIKKARKIKSKVIITTIFPLGDVSIARKVLGIKEKPIIEAIDIINNYIQTLKEENVFIFDSFSLLVGNKRKIDPRYSHDWLHLNKSGYLYLNQNLNIFIDKKVLAK